MKKLLIIILLAFMFVAPRAHAANKAFEVTGWIPYWRAATGTQEALQHLDQLTEINIFGYTVKNDGRLNDTAKIDEEPWLSLIAAARAKGVRVIPTVMWGDGQAIDRVMKNKILRDAQIADIVAMVNSHNFDGVDIDYEAKLAETKNYYSTFLKDLYKAMGKKFVMCEIESRTPVTSRYDIVPNDFNPNDVANDYVAINKYCDRVRIMTYDQGRVDLRLNQANPGLYAPVSDPKWVEKVVNLAAQTISKNKIDIGIPTYGYEYQVTPGGIGGYTYERQWAFNPKYATDIAKTLGITPTRNGGGELSFLYYPYASTTPAGAVLSNIQTNLLVWSDASAIADKVALAKKLGVKGVAVFKFDGGGDPAMWNYLK